MIDERRLHWLFGAALTLCYVAFTPGTIEGQGYNFEQVAAADQLATNLGRVLTGRPLVPVEWARHGGLEPLLLTPFAAVSHVLFGPSPKWVARVAVLQPILATALLCTLLFGWSLRLTASRQWSYVLALGAGLTTMLWPYAYIGLETTQALLLLVAGYCALERERKGNWPETLLFAAVCASAVCVKSNGLFLLPAVGFLVFTYFRRALRRDWWKIAVAAAVGATIYCANNAAKARYGPAERAGVESFVAELIVDLPVAGLQAFSFFGSPNKSLFIYCPLLALSCAGLGDAYRRRPDLAVFALLALGGLVGGSALFWFWADETWGPRYLHAAVAPLIVCLAATKARRPFAWRRERPLAAALLLGGAVSLLGAWFPYVALHQAATRAAQATMDALQYDIRLNHVGFNLKLMRVWLHERIGAAPAESWPQPPRWWFERPAEMPPERTVDLREWAAPQPLLARGWNEAVPISSALYRLLRGCCALCLAAGATGLVWVWRRAA